MIKAHIKVAKLKYTNSQKPYLLVNMADNQTNQLLNKKDHKPTVVLTGKQIKYFLQILGYPLLSKNIEAFLATKPDPGLIPEFIGLGVVIDPDKAFDFTTDIPTLSPEVAKFIKPDLDYNYWLEAPIKTPQDQELFDCYSKNGAFAVYLDQKYHQPWQVNDYIKTRLLKEQIKNLKFKNKNSIMYFINRHTNIKNLQQQLELQLALQDHAYHEDTKKETEKIRRLWH